MLEGLVCPVCKSGLVQLDGGLACENASGRHWFPIVDGIPVLIRENGSLFSIDDFIEKKETTLQLGESKLRKIIKRFTPKLGGNITSRNNFEKFRNILLEKSEFPKVLVIGGSIVGKGMESLISHESIEFIESDVSYGPRTKIIFDAHDIPFEDELFDGVLAQAVLEHVVDPYRCVAEMYRVLKHDGVLYAETAFMQQVHGGRYDFTRFTYLGHRRLFRNFSEIDSGATGGPGTALAWSWQYFLLSFVKSKQARDAMKVFCRMTTFFLKYFDHYLANFPRGLDGASGYYFLGVKSNEVLADKELIKLYPSDIKA